MLFLSGLAVTALVWRDVGETLAEASPTRPMPTPTAIIHPKNVNADPEPHAEARERCHYARGRRHRPGENHPVDPDSDRIALTRIFRGVGWFLHCDLVVVILMISFPALSLFLPSLMN